MTISRRKGSPYLWYDFTIAGVRYRGSTSTDDLRLANKFEKTMRKQALIDIQKKLAEKKSINRLLRYEKANEWKKLRYKVLKNSNGICSACGATAHDGAKLHVDHIKPKKHYPELAFQEDNLQVLCADCNIGKGTKDTTDWRKRLKNG